MQRCASRRIGTKTAEAAQVAEVAAEVARLRK
jgi:hypothetical protein